MRKWVHISLLGTMGGDEHGRWVLCCKSLGSIGDRTVRGPKGPLYFEDNAKGEDSDDDT